MGNRERYAVSEMNRLVSLNYNYHRRYAKSVFLPDAIVDRSSRGTA